MEALVESARVAQPREALADPTGLAQPDNEYDYTIIDGAQHFQVRTYQLPQVAPDALADLYHSDMFSVSRLGKQNSRALRVYLPHDASPRSLYGLDEVRGCPSPKVRLPLLLHPFTWVVMGVLGYSILKEEFTGDTNRAREREEERVIRALNPESINFFFLYKNANLWKHPEITPAPLATLNEIASRYEVAIAGTKNEKGYHMTLTSNRFVADKFNDLQKRIDDILQK